MLESVRAFQRAVINGTPMFHRRMYAAEKRRHRLYASICETMVSIPATSRH